MEIWGWAALRVCMFRCGDDDVNDPLGLLQMETLAPSTRGCRFAWEADSLSYHSRWCRWFLLCNWCSQRYSHSSCRLECGIREALATSDCLPWCVWSVHNTRRNVCNEFWLFWSVHERTQVCNVFHIGICPRTPTTQKVHAGASIFVHKATKQK